MFFRTERVERASYFIIASRLDRSFMYITKSYYAGVVNRPVLTFIENAIDIICSVCSIVVLNRNVPVAQSEPLTHGNEDVSSSSIERDR